MGILQTLTGQSGPKEGETTFLPALSLPEVIRERMAAQEAEHVRGLSELAGLDGTVRRQFSLWRFEATHPGKIAMAFKAMLLYGPTGVGKSALAQALSKDAGEYAVLFDPKELAAKGQDIYDPAVLFGEIVYLATQMKAEDQPLYGGKKGPANKSRRLIVLLDEVDRFFPQREAGDRENPTSKALVWMSELENYDNVWVIGTTNHPEHLDEAMFSRFRNQLEVNLPDNAQLIDLLAYFIAEIDDEAQKQDRNLFEPGLIDLVHNYREIAQDYHDYITKNPKSKPDTDSTLKKKINEVGDAAMPLARVLGGVLRAASGLAHRDVAGVMESLASNHHVLLVQKDARDAIGIDTEDVNGITLLDIEAALARKRAINRRREVNVQAERSIRRGR